MKPAAAQQFLTARESDPGTLGWMQGFPPPEGKLLSAVDGSFFEFPALRYSVAHMREFLPTVGVSRGLQTPVPFKSALDEAIDELVFQPWGSGAPLTWEASLWKNYTDGILVLHRGAIVFERYFGALTAANQHAAMSVTKSFTGTLGASLLADGLLDESVRVVDYVSELQGSAFAYATVRQLLDMTTALRYSEKYSDPNAEVWKFSSAGNPTPKPGYSGPVGYFEYLQTVQKEGEHGEAFGYKTVNSDALGWIIARVTGKSVANLLAEKVWSRIGMEQAAYYQVDAKGTPFSGGGLSAGLRDMARFGELIRNEGLWQDEQILPQEAIADIRKGGSPEVFAKAGFSGLEGWSYRNMWWVTHNANEAFAARGVHGQTIYIDPTAEMVIVRFASHPLAANAASDPYSLPAYAAVARHLQERG